ncbi:MAG: hypothetical protein JRI68_12145 [Deltaproteobacteria bacterium]|nr:hypothetical protein [Deltaproteobacteria bacterium]
MNPPDPQDSCLAFARCAEMERIMAELYQFFAQTHRRWNDLYRLWTKTAREEENHARQFELAERMAGDVEALHITAEQAAGLVAGMRRVLDQVRETPPSPIQALEQAVRLEQRLAKFHLTSLAEFAQPTTRKLFEAMLAADQEHVAALERRLEVERKRSVEPPPE